MTTTKTGTIGSLNLPSRSTLRVFCTGTDRHANWCGALAVTAHQTHGTPGHVGTPATCEACFYGTDDPRQLLMLSDGELDY